MDWWIANIFELAECNECDGVCEVIHEPPSRTAISNDYWCLEHEPEISNGWRRILRDDK